MFSSNTSQVSQDAIFVEDVFSTYLYTGTGSTQTITNGIDLSGKGGLVWSKCRTFPQDNMLIDTVRGGDKRLTSNGTNASFTSAQYITSFSGTGYSIGNDNDLNRTKSKHIRNNKQSNSHRKRTKRMRQHGNQSQVYRTIQRLNQYCRQ